MQNKTTRYKNAGKQFSNCSARLVVVFALSIIVVTGLSGCASSTGITIDDRVFTVGPVRLVSTSNQWEVIITAPTGGWQARFDTDRPMFGGRDVFITLTSPNPDMFVTQSVTDLHVLTPAPSDNDIDIFVRVQEFRIKDGSPPGLRQWLFGAKDPNPPYHFAATNISPRDPAP